LPPAYWKFLAGNVVFFLGNSSDVFLILRAKDLGLSSASAVFAYVIYNLTFALSAAPAGILSDRLGRRRVMQAGFMLFAGVYAGFAWAPSTFIVWPLFALYGFYAALTEGVSKAAIADLVAPAHRGGAIGVFYLATGFAALIANGLAGWLWKEFGPSTALIFSAALAFSAGIFLFAWKERR